MIEKKKKNREKKEEIKEGGKYSFHNVIPWFENAATDGTNGRSVFINERSRYNQHVYVTFI